MIISFAFLLPLTVCWINFPAFPPGQFNSLQWGHNFFQNRFDSIETGRPPPPLWKPLSMFEKQFSHAKRKQMFLFIFLNFVLPYHYFASLCWIQEKNHMVISGRKSFLRSLISFLSSHVLITTYSHSFNLKQAFTNKNICNDE